MTNFLLAAILVQLCQINGSLATSEKMKTAYFYAQICFFIAMLLSLISMILKLPQP